MSRPRKPASAGSALRDAIKNQRADEEAAAQRLADTRQSAAEKTLSDWFNQVATDLKRDVKDLTMHAGSGRHVQTQLTYAAPPEALRAMNGVALETLPGFKTLEETSRQLDVSATVEHGRRGYGRKAHAGEPYLYVSVDLEKPHSNVSVETPKPRRNNRFR